MGKQAGGGDAGRAPRYLPGFFLSLGGRYKRIRRRPAKELAPLHYAETVERLAEVEALAEAGELTLFYGDESHVCQDEYVPYGWQFSGEDVFVPAQKGFRPYCWGLFSRDNQSYWATTEYGLTAAFAAKNQALFRCKSLAQTLLC